MYPKEVASRISTIPQVKEGYARYADRLVFGPEDVEKVPSRQIFQYAYFMHTFEAIIPLFPYSLLQNIGFLFDLSLFLQSQG